MRHASTIRLTALAAACLACSSVTAQEHDPTALDPVVVTATRTATTVDASLAAVEQGEQITITRRGQPIARLVAAGPVRRETSQRQRVATVFARMKQQRKGVTMEGDIRELIAAGRD